MTFDLSHFGFSADTLPEGWREGRLYGIARNLKELGYGD
jgi:hypothetical protein